MLSLQDSASPLMEQLTFFHDHTMIILTLVVILVSLIMMKMFVNKMSHRYLLEGQTIEIIWTSLPALTLILIAFPSLQVLYLMEDNDASMTIKTMGHQWYWSYEYSDYVNIEFDSYMIPSDSLNSFNFRLLDVDNRLVIPYQLQIRMIISSADVIHSWTIPSLGIKMDGTPGRLNQSSFFINQASILYGQCSEICGTNHSFMPIVIESVSPKNFLKWIKTF
uniref:Cytochrome c oxidase subunit 2 n=1 Tax=Platypus contaminatus TaxID=2066526 RepID=A0A6C0RVB1_9CUCU|nr:cytochrome c oxidase subunit II [Platypus contaminatus]QIA44530.1 cytochrome c oxidase subunit 2 [Platypus contaminatus]